MFRLDLRPGDGSEKHHESDANRPYRELRDIKTTCVVRIEPNYAWCAFACNAEWQDVCEVPDVVEN